MMWGKKKKEEVPKADVLKRQIAQEAKELKNAPSIVITHGLERCHVCGQLFDRVQLRSYDTHISGRLVRRACPNCHPERGIL